MFKNLKDSKAFTLIEVVIVIAIGALIILVVLQAVSNAQQSQRDSTRRQEAGQISAALEQYAANNQGDYPGGAAILDNDVLQGGYVSDTVKENWSDNGDVTAGTGAAGDCEDLEPSANDLYYEQGTGSRDYRLHICLEQGNDPVEIRQDD